jgi:hypothetical protein
MEFQNRETITPPAASATEEQLIRWLAVVACVDIAGHEMFWRQRIREKRTAFLEACAALVDRLERERANPKMQPVRNRGGWLSDVFHKLKYQSKL